MKYNSRSHICRSTA